MRKFDGTPHRARIVRAWWGIFAMAGGFMAGFAYAGWWPSFGVMSAVLLLDIWVFLRMRSSWIDQDIERDEWNRRLHYLQAEWDQ